MVDGQSESGGGLLRALDDGAKTFPLRCLGTAEFSHPACALAVGRPETSHRLGRCTSRSSIVVRVSLTVPVIRAARAGQRRCRWAGFRSSPADRSISVAWSEESVESAVHAAQVMPNMKDPKAVMGLHAVGTAQVLVRRGTIL